MPKFFSRRYMRGAPRMTERVVGAVILVLLAFIVGSFLLTGGLFANLVNRVPPLRAVKNAYGIPERPLFVPAPENVRPPAPPHEVRVAESMLPELPAPMSRREVRIISLAADQPEAISPVREGRAVKLKSVRTGFEGLEVVQLFGVSTVYHASYGSGKVSDWHAWVADAGDPATAFGLFAARRPPNAKPMALGRGGWQADEPTAIGFWSGRYYTEAKGVSEPADPELLAQFARSLAELQLVYGGPFWAESVLPRDALVPYSFRYVRTEPLGLAELSDCWLADYPDGVTLGVMQPASPDKMLGALRARFAQADTGQVKSASGEDESIASEEEAVPSEETAAAGEETYSSSGNDEESGEYADEGADEPASGGAIGDLAAALGNDAVSGRVGDRHVVAFTAGPYLFVAAAERPESMLALGKATRERWAARAVAGAATAELEVGAQPAAGQARFAALEGSDIQPPAKIERYTDNLYEKINGREGMFRAFGFVELRFGQYLDTRRKQTYDAYLYNMAEPNNAMGIYMKEKSGETQPLELGREGYTSGANAYFYKSRYYVNVLGPAEPDEAAKATAVRIATAIADTIADEGGKLWAEDVLPKEGRTSESLDYVMTSALGHEFLERVFLASYPNPNGKGNYKLFIHKAPGAQEAKALFDRYVEATGKYDDIVSQTSADGGAMVVSKSKGEFNFFTAAFHKGPYFGGVSDCEDNRELAEEQAAMLRERVNADDPGEPAPTRPEPAAGEGGGDSEEGGDHGY
ncbi:MAG: hypothetical protein AMXMBFR13_41320 [Phycisphaerae bacterium]